MKRIIKPGYRPKTDFRFSCINCGCVFECDSDEYAFAFNSNKNVITGKTKCPNCGCTVKGIRYVNDYFGLEEGE